MPLPEYLLPAAAGQAARIGIHARHPLRHLAGAAPGPPKGQQCHQPLLHLRVSTCVCVCVRV